MKLPKQVRFNPIKLLSRGRDWKDFIQNAAAQNAERATVLEADLTAVQERISELEADLVTARLRTSELEAQLSQQTEVNRAQIDATRLRVHRFEHMLRDILPGMDIATLSLLVARRAGEVIFFPTTNSDSLKLGIRGDTPHEVIAAICRGEILQGHVTGPPERRIASDTGARLVAAIAAEPVGANDWFLERSPALDDPAAIQKNKSDRLQTVVVWPGLIDFFARHGNEPNQPFDRPAALPGFAFAEPKRRSVLFTHQCYYNFYYLAKALRARGWDAVSLSTEGPESPNRRFYQGEDVTVYDADPATHQRLIQAFLTRTADRFGIIHTYGVGILSLFPSNHDGDIHHTCIPWDILEAKRRGVLIGYSHSGCMDGVSQTAFRSWSPSMCANCVWEDQPQVCSDTRNLSWGKKLTTIVDLFCTETDPPMDYKGAAQVFRAPLTFAMNPEFWRPDLDVPEHLRIEREADEIVVYHAMGNYELRSREGRNVKGTSAVIRAIDVLQQEGLKLKLAFVKDVPSTDNRFIQVQADIIIDQLNYGRYGALAREGMLLGKPVVGRVNKTDTDRLPATKCILETPIIDADENSVTNILRMLATDHKLRAEVGARSRKHAIHWWSADRLAERFEKVYDHVRDHGRPPAEDQVA